MQDDDEEIQIIKHTIGQVRNPRTTTVQSQRWDPPSVIHASIRARKPKRGESSRQPAAPPPRTKEPEVITISSDEEEDQPVIRRNTKKRPNIEQDSSERPSKQQRMRPKPLPVKPTPPVRISSPKEPSAYDGDGDADYDDQGYMPDLDEDEDEDVGILAATDIYDENMFKPMVPQELKVNSTHVKASRVTYSPPKRSNRRPRITNASSGINPEHFSAGDSRPLWKKLEPIEALLCNLKIKPETPHFSRPRRTISHNHAPRMIHLEKSVGSINRIVQRGGLVAVATSTPGGDSSSDSPGSNGEESEVDAGNGPGTSFVWDGTNKHLLRSHDRNFKLEITETDEDEIRRKRIVDRTKYYTVNDIKFDPSSSRMVTSACDKKIYVMGYSLNEDNLYTAKENDETRSTLEKDSFTFNDVPLDLAFKPDGNQSILAVAARQIYLFNDISYIANAEPAILHAVDRDQSASAGSFTWGVGASSNALFVSTEPANYNDGKGSHRCFDVQTQKRVFQFDATEAGDAIALDYRGEKLALLTRTSSENFLRLYESQNSKMSRNTPYKVPLMPSQVPGLPLEVNTATFSPDGIYIAIARRDNRTHVYDHRRLDKLLYDFEHWGCSRISPGHASFGVTQVEWTQSLTSSLGLITGGNDGCVRLWRPLWASDNRDGRILCEADADIGYFTLGDKFKQEHDLVVGDADGRVYIVDGFTDL